MQKIITVFALASMVAIPLVGCSTPANSGCMALPGPHSSQITATGTFGDEPTVTLPPAFEATETERSVLISGTGESAVEGQLVEAHYAVYNASTGQAIELNPGSTWSKGNFVLTEKQNDTLPGLYKSLICSKAGDRVVSAVPSSELFGGLNMDLSDRGIGSTDTVVFIFDVSNVGPAPTPTPTPSPTAAPLPTPTEWVDNVPAVDLSGDVPVVTLPDAPPSEELELTVIAEGTGDTVADLNASVTVDYQGISWDDGTIFDQSYTREGPSSFAVSGVIQGFAAAMIGQKVGSTLLVTIPPKYAYGLAGESGHALAGQTLVFLIQIRDVLNAE